MFIQENLKGWYRRCLSLKGEPRALALGFALGIFIGVTPTIPFHTAIIIGLGILFRQNITAAYLASWLISNPLTIPFFYIAEYELGRYLLGMPGTMPTFNSYTLDAMLLLGWEILLPLLAGGFLLAPLFAVPGFFLARQLFTRIRSDQRP
ncbi:MAG: DUF2062 domain-containing protein [Syntrophales bacterium]|nr:DUF2062 domain-containing protein [Syntrophales bacterium]HQN24832.1 DUF2062 domain-containing protein [Syntrophales bacterium]HQP28674.1 DUF2062 domain-containing protein [Syntrophales bacterium]